LPPLSAWRTFDKGHRVKRFTAALNRIATGGRHIQPFAGHFHSASPLMA
jgi:hypothetical protein